MSKRVRTSSVRRLGLSLGADRCWPAAFEALLSSLDPCISWRGEQVRFDVSRVPVAPFSLREPVGYDLVIDRLCHWFPHRREWVKKAVLMDDVYVLNHPWAIQAMEKSTTYCALMRLGLPVPETWMIPAKDYDEDFWDTRETIQRYNTMFDLNTVGEGTGLPAWLKPYDGGGWVGVRRVRDRQELREAYDASGERVHLLQESVEGWDLFVRALGVGPSVRVARYEPDQPLHARYAMSDEGIDAAARLHATRLTRTINAFFGWDFNSCEALRVENTFHPIDFANAVPDAQVTSLHRHFPWVVTSLLKWALYCATTRRKPATTLPWDRFFAVSDPEMSIDERLEAYDAVARSWFEAEAFEAFCGTHMVDLDALAADYFASEPFRAVVRDKVSALYPEHEIDAFTAYFFDAVQAGVGEARVPALLG